MTQQEFQARVKMQVSIEEFDAINTVYMASDVEKDEFCKMWKQMNAKRVAAYIKAEKEEAERRKNVRDLFELKNRLRYVATEKKDWNGSVENVLTQKELRLLDKVGISVLEPSYVGYESHYKTIGTLVYKICEYIEKEA